MKCISFFIHICGMTGVELSERVMLDEPIRSVELFYNLDHEESPRINDSISKVVKFLTKEEYSLLSCLDPLCLEKLCYKNIYTEYKGYYFGFNKDLELKTLFELLNTNHLKFHYFFVAGGASRTYLGYLFVIHTDEYVHRNGEPHVHVEIEGKSPRYSLNTFKMFEGDKHAHEHIRDKKKIKKYLKKNKKWFMEKWDLYIKGLIPPDETIDGKQLMKES